MNPFPLALRLAVFIAAAMGLSALPAAAWAQTNEATPGTPVPGQAPPSAAAPAPGGAPQTNPQVAPSMGGPQLNPQTVPFAPASPQAPPPAAPRGGRTQTIAPIASRDGEVVLNFQGADLQQVVKAISEMTGRNLLIDPRVRGQFTIFSARPMPVAAAYQVFLSALKAQGFTAVDGPGDVVRIIPVAEAKASAPVSAEGAPRGGEQIVTHVVVAQHVAVSQLQNVLRP